MTDPGCGGRFALHVCVLERGHEETGSWHRDAEGVEWPSHVPAPGGVCISRPAG